VLQCGQAHCCVSRVRAAGWERSEGSAEPTYSEVNDGVAQACGADEEKKDKCVKEKEAEEFVVVVAHAVGDPKSGGD
jgi:hypothetical protein